MARALVQRADARSLPLSDASVDLIVTSPPYYQLRSYADGGKPLEGQIGSEETPAEYIAVLLDCTREWMRVLKPEGSLFVNLGDKYSQPGKGIRNQQGIGGSIVYSASAAFASKSAHDVDYGEIQAKSLLGLPWRYAIGCIDQLGLILRAEIIWHKVNGLPESVADRVRRSHEQLFHFVKQPRYYSAVDEIREPHARDWSAGARGGLTYRKLRKPGEKDWNLAECTPNPSGRLPGSVWEIASEPLNLPGWLGVDHYAAFPTALVRPVILGWSPSAICAVCGQGRFPVAGKQFEVQDRILGYACACTPYTDHPERRRPSVTPGRALGRGHQDNDVRAAQAGSRHHGSDWPERLPVREYHLDRWTPPPARPAVVADPFGGTGTTALVAAAHGRVGFSFDVSADYCRAAQWRTRDSGERMRALGQPRPPAGRRVRAELYGTVMDELDALLAEVNGEP